jgi:hypothetical protein
MYITCAVLLKDILLIIQHMYVLSQPLSPPLIEDMDITRPTRASLPLLPAVGYQIYPSIIFTTPCRPVTVSCIPQPARRTMPIQKVQSGMRTRNGTSWLS